MAIAIWAEARGRREVFATRIVICGEKLSELKHGERERDEWTVVVAPESVVRGWSGGVFPGQLLFGIINLSST